MCKSKQTHHYFRLERINSTLALYKNKVNLINDVISKRLDQITIRYGWIKDQITN